MSFQIMEPGKHRTAIGASAKVMAVDRASLFAFGVSDSEQPRIWDAADGTTIFGPASDSIVGEWVDAPPPPDGFQVMPRDYVAKAGDQWTCLSGNHWTRCVDTVGRTAESMGRQMPESEVFYIASPIPKPAKPDPGEGYRLLDDGEMPQKGDECRFRDNPNDPWDESVNWRAGCPQSPLCFYRRRIPKRFRISDNGPGRYETRKHEDATVTHESENRWFGTIGKCGACWGDGGGYSKDDGTEFEDDLVRYIGPLEEPQPESRPPIGIKPRAINDEQRCDELKAAIRRFRDAKRKVPRDWYEELCDLLDREVQP